MFLIMRTEKKIKDILKSIKINIRLKSDLYNQLDSMQFLKLLTELEKKFKVKIPDKKINIWNNLLPPNLRDQQNNYWLFCYQDNNIEKPKVLCSIYRSFLFH